MNVSQYICNTTVSTKNSSYIGVMSKQIARSTVSNALQEVHKWGTPRGVRVLVQAIK